MKSTLSAKAIIGHPSRPGPLFVGLAIFFLATTSWAEEWSLEIRGSGREVFTPPLEAGKWYTFIVSGTLSHSQLGWLSRYTEYNDSLYTSDDHGNLRIRSVNLLIDEWPAALFLVKEERHQNRYTFAVKGRGEPLPLRYKNSNGVSQGDGALEVVISEFHGAAPYKFWGDVWRRVRAMGGLPLLLLLSVVGVFFGALFVVVLAVLLSRLGRLLSRLWPRRRFRLPAPRAPVVETIVKYVAVPELAVSAPSRPLLPVDPKKKEEERQERLRKRAEELKRKYEPLDNYAEGEFVEAQARNNGKELLKQLPEILKSYHEVRDDPKLYAYIEKNEPRLLACLNGRLKGARRAERYLVQGVPEDSDGSRLEKLSAGLNARFGEKNIYLKVGLEWKARLRKKIKDQNFPETEEQFWLEQIDTLTAEVLGTEGEENEPPPEIVE